MRDYHISIFYSEDDEGYIADIPDLVACSARHLVKHLMRHCMRFNRQKHYGWKLHGKKANLFGYPKARHRKNCGYLDYFDPENSDIGTKNAYSWNNNP